MTTQPVTLKYPKEVEYKLKNSSDKILKKGELSSVDSKKICVFKNGDSAYLDETRDAKTKTSLLTISRNREKAGLSNTGTIEELNSTIVDAYQKTSNNGKTFDVKEHVRKLNNEIKTLTKELQGNANDKKEADRQTAVFKKIQKAKKEILKYDKLGRS